jgi:hypothetical protein
MDDAPDPVDAEERKARRKRVVFWTIAVIFLVPTAAMIVVNRIETEVPPPLWTKDSLPAPAEADNGWELIKHYHSTTISGIDLTPLDKLLAAARDGNKLPKLAPLFSPARVVASKIRKHTKICSDAFERKRMVIPCLSIEANACKTEPLEICTRIVTFAALDEASRGSARGVRHMSNVLRQLRDTASNSPHPWVQARGLVVLRQAIHHASVIIKWRRTDASPLRESLQAISEETLPLKNVAIASYLLKHMALRKALDQADTWLLDEGGIMRGLNAPFQVVNEGGELPAPPNYKSGLFWWFDNPIGKKMLDTVKPGADKDFVHTTELRASLLKRREEALKLK